MKHGMRHKPEYQAWINMRRRCAQKEHVSWHHYGGRGISVCERWKDDFMAFYADVGPRPTSRHTIERKDNDRGYEPDNCVWATVKEQANNRRSSRLYTYKGKTQCMRDWAKELGLDPSTVRKRLLKGLPLEKALSSASYLRRKKLTLRGRTQDLMDWSRELGIKENTLWGRVVKGWPDDKVLLTPVRGQ